MDRNKRATVMVCAGLGMVVGMAEAQVVPVNVSRTLNVSIFLEAPGREYVQQFDQYQHPAVPQPYSPLVQSIELNNDGGGIVQRSIAGQRSALLDGHKIIDATLFGTLRPGEWSRGLNANSLTGMSSELYLTARLTRPTEVSFIAEAAGSMGAGSTLTADILVSRAGVRAFEFNFTPPAAANSFFERREGGMMLGAGDWVFEARVNGSGRGGQGPERGASMSLFFAATTNIPAPGALALLGMGLCLMRRRERTAK